MPIQFHCPDCGKTLRVPSAKAGKRGRCKGCGIVVRIPAKTTEFAPDASAAEFASDARTSFEPDFASAAGELPEFLAGQPTGDESSSQLPPETTDDPFSQLPAFEAPSGMVAKPKGVDESFHRMMLSDSTPSDVVINGDTVSQSARTPRTPGLSGPAIDLDDISDRIEGMEDVIRSAVALEQQRAKAKLSPQEIRRAFGRPLGDLERGNQLQIHQLFVILAVMFIPALFVGSIVAGSYFLFLEFRGWQRSGSLPHPGVGLTMIVLGLGLLFCWVPALNLIFAAITIPFRRSAVPLAVTQLTRESQPVMYEFVEQICEKLDAPKPVRIDLNCECNAMVSPMKGTLFGSSNDLVLTIGVPLIATQNAQQLASVIAHEFGHFRQGAARRTSFLTGLLTQWFVQSAHSSFGYFMYFASFTHWLSQSLSREMERDADRHAVHLAGTRAFEESSALLERHSVAYAVTVENVFNLYQSGILVDNFPRFMVHIGRTMPASAIRRIAESTEKQRLDRFDTHPPTRDRVRFARELNQDGVVSLHRPSTDLIDHWTKLCEKITLDFYAERIGVPRSELNESHTTPLNQLLREEHKLLLDLADEKERN